MLKCLIVVLLLTTCFLVQAETKRKLLLTNYENYPLKVLGVSDSGKSIIVMRGRRSRLNIFIKKTDLLLFRKNARGWKMKKLDSQRNKSKMYGETLTLVHLSKNGRFIIYAKAAKYKLPSMKNIYVYDETTGKKTQVTILHKQTISWDDVKEKVLPFVQKRLATRETKDNIDKHLFSELSFIPRKCEDNRAVILKHLKRDNKKNKIKHPLSFNQFGKVFFNPNCSEAVFTGKEYLEKKIGLWGKIWRRKWRKYKAHLFSIKFLED